MDNQVKPKHNFKFGDLVENHYASEGNPRRIGIFIKKNSKGHLEMTDGKGEFWLSAADNDKLVKIGSVISDTPPVPTIKPGDKVRHSKYGHGDVKKISAWVWFSDGPEYKAISPEDLEVVE